MSGEGEAIGVAERIYDCVEFNPRRRSATNLVPTDGHESDKVHHDYITVGREALKAAVGTFPKL